MKFTVLNDNRILTFKTPKGKLVFVLTIRSGKSFIFNIDGIKNKQIKGHRYTASERDILIGNWKCGQNFGITIPDKAIEFWVEQ